MLLGILSELREGAFLTSKLCIYMPAIDRSISVLAGYCSRLGGAAFTPGSIESHRSIDPTVTFGGTITK